MRRLRIDPLSALVRVYKDPVDARVKLSELKEPYYKTFVLIFSDDGTVRVQGALTAPTPEELADLEEALKDKGYNKVFWRHKHKNIEWKLDG
jgi:hypothetical protein